jgi:hypothetical protein
MARHRRRSKKNPRRSTRRGSNGWIKRHGKWVKAALARGGRKARSARRGRKSRSSKRTHRRSSRSRRGRHSYRRNPASSEFHDGTSISISGDTVTLLTPYGETYEYSEVDSRARARVMTCKTASQAKKILNASGVLAAINPKRGKKSRRYRIMDRSPGWKSRRGRKPRRSKRSRRNCGRY